jgi:DNA-binding ferritin-like protein
LADTITLRDMYKKHHWQVSGPTFYQLHLLFDKHASEQSELVDSLAERIQTLGGISIAMAHDVAETTNIPRLPRGRQEVPVQLAKLLQAHEMILLEARSIAKHAAKSGDDGPATTIPLYYPTGLAFDSADNLYTTDYSGNKGHDRHIDFGECQNIGLKVKSLESDQELQDLVLTVHHCYMHLLMNTSAFKIIENQTGAAFVKNAAQPEPK